MKKEIRCENCKYYIGKTLKDIKEQRATTTDGIMILYLFWDGKCCRFPKAESKQYGDFCGEFKLK